MPVVVVSPGPQRAAVRAVDRKGGDWDGVHLSVAGYLATAGRALPVGKARTLLAGWNPDETYWLTDVLTPAGQAQAWHNDSDARLGWNARTDIRRVVRRRRRAGSVR